MGSVRSTSTATGVIDDRFDYTAGPARAPSILPIGARPEGTHDVFGQPFQGDLDGLMNLGYMSKPYESVTGLYNYGFRDYRPQQARFTTPDPIRDGNNWFAYVNNDPVNYVDLWGLCKEDVRQFKFNSFQVGQDLTGSNFIDYFINNGNTAKFIYDGGGGSMYVEPSYALPSSSSPQTPQNNPNSENFERLLAGRLGFISNHNESILYDNNGNQIAIIQHDYNTKQIGFTDDEKYLWFVSNRLRPILPGEQPFYPFIPNFPSIPCNYIMIFNVTDGEFIQAYSTMENDFIFKIDDNQYRINTTPPDLPG